jgi:hypothetical protein
MKKRGIITDDQVLWTESMGFDYPPKS